MNFLAIILCKINLRKRKKDKSTPVNATLCVSISGWYWCLTFHHIQPEPKAMSLNISRQTKGKGKATNWQQFEKMSHNCYACDPTLVGDVCHRGPAGFFWAKVASCGSSQQRCYNELATVHAVHAACHVFNSPPVSFDLFTFCPRE